MGKRIILLLILVVAGLTGFFYYKHHQEELRIASGEVTCDGCMTPEQHNKFLRENAAESADAQSERRAKTTVVEDPRTSSSAVAATTATASPATALTGDPQVTPSSASTPPAETAQATPAPGLAASAPRTDTVSHNPTNGMVFTGKGTYQWYRQGNLTWRVDTTSGRSCIIYATMEEWRKQIVLSHGCGRAA